MIASLDITAARRDGRTYLKKSFWQPPFKIADVAEDRPGCCLASGSFTEFGAFGKCSEGIRTSISMPVWCFWIGKLGYSCHQES
jgi:hypothetical protein